MDKWFYENNCGITKFVQNYDLWSGLLFHDPSWDKNIKKEVYWIINNGKNNKNIKDLDARRECENVGKNTLFPNFLWVVKNIKQVVKSDKREKNSVALFSGGG